jgi:hypothetical protein
MRVISVSIACKFSLLSIIWCLNNKIGIEKSGRDRLVESTRNVARASHKDFRLALYRIHKDFRL